MSSPDLSLNDALALVRDATQAEHVALRAARDTVIRTAPLNGPIQPALANIDERVFRLHLAMKLLERVVEAELIRRARANEAGPAVPAEPDPPVPVAVSELDDDDPF